MTLSERLLKKGKNAIWGAASGGIFAIIFTALFGFYLNIEYSRLYESFTEQSPLVFVYIFGIVFLTSVLVSLLRNTMNPIVNCLLSIPVFIGILAIIWFGIILELFYFAASMAMIAMLTMLVLCIIAILFTVFNRYDETANDVRLASGLAGMVIGGIVGMLALWIFYGILGGPNDQLFQEFVESVPYGFSVIVCACALVTFVVCLIVCDEYEYVISFFHGLWISLIVLFFILLISFICALIGAFGVVPIVLLVLLILALVSGGGTIVVYIVQG